MTNFKRVMIYLRRNKIKTIVLAIIIFILGTFIIGIDLMRTAVYQTTERLWEGMPSVATSTWDWETATNSAQTTGDEAVLSLALTPEAIREVGNLPYVRHFDYSFRHHLWSDELEWYGFDQLEFNHPLGTPGVTMRFGMQGVYHLEVLDVQEGIIEIVMGQTLSGGTSDNAYIPALISTELAQLNHLSVGDTFTLEDRKYDDEVWQTNEFTNDDFIISSQTLQLEIVGIFEVSATPDSNQPNERIGSGQTASTPNFSTNLDDITLAEMRNRIYVPSSALENLPTFDVNLIGSIDFNAGHLPSYFLLEDPRDMPAFIHLANDILPGGWVIADLSGNFSQLTASMDMMSQMIDGVYWGVLVSVVIILTLTMLLFAYDRRHEVGIYLALGMKRGTLMKTFLLEALLVATFSLTLAVGSSFFFAQQLSTLLLEQEIANQVADGYHFHVHNNLSWFNPGVIPLEELLTRFNIGLDISSLLFALMICILAIIVATGVPLWYLSALKPKKVLM